MESSPAYLADVRRPIPRDLPGDRVGVSPERPCQNHRVASPRRDLPLTGPSRSRHRLEHYCDREPQLACDQCLALTLFLRSRRINTSLFHTKARSLGPITATAIASRPAAGRVTSQGRTMPRKADRIDSLRPRLPAVSAVTCAANGVPFLVPLNPQLPAVDQTITLPLSSAIDTIVLLKDD